MKSLIGKLKAVHGGQGGFTLLEMMVVLAIMGIIVGLVVPNMFGSVSQAHSTQIQGQHEKMQEAVFNYYADTGQFPTEWSANSVSNKPGQHQLWKKDNVNGWDGPYIDRPILQDDAWDGNWGVVEGTDVGLVNYDCALQYNNVPEKVCKQVDAAMDDGKQHQGAVQYKNSGELEIGIARE